MLLHKLKRYSEGPLRRDCEFCSPTACVLPRSLKASSTKWRRGDHRTTSFIKLLYLWISVRVTGRVGINDSIAVRATQAADQRGTAERRS